MIISAKNEASRLEECFASLRAQKTKIPFEVHFVDNNSTDGTYRLARKLAAKEKRAFFVWKEKKPGAPAARNRGARKARGSILVFTDADCTHDPRWLDELAKPLLKPTHYPLAAVGGFTKSAFRFRNQPNALETYLDGLFSFCDADRLQAEPTFLPWAPVCNLAVRADIFKGLGGFEERWRSAAYDVDFCWRLALCGFVCGFNPRAQARHLRRGSLRAFFRQMENYAYYNQAMLSTYEKELSLSAFFTRTERLLHRGRRTLTLLKKTTNLKEARNRGLDALVNVAALKGALESQLTAKGGDPRLSATRRGLTPKKLQPLLPLGYNHLHSRGWVYWKSPPNTDRGGDLMLFQPKSGERYRFSEAAWKIWEIKCERGQSEDAAMALGKRIDDETALREIDQTTLDLRTRRLLP